MSGGNAFEWGVTLLSGDRLAPPREVEVAPPPLSANPLSPLAESRSGMVVTSRSPRAARSTASLTTLASSAPVKPGVARATTSSQGEHFASYYAALSYRMFLY